MEKVKLTIGDWSGSGHSQNEVFVYEVNKTVSEIRQGYKASCKKTGIQFNHNENYTGLKEHSGYGSKLHICTEYNECYFSEEAKEIISNYGIDFSWYGNGGLSSENAEDFAQLILEFIKISIPDFEWEETSFKKSELSSIQPINGWWNSELNVQLGYGLFE